MALTKSFSHQRVRAACITVLGANIAAAAASNPLIDLPAGAQVVGGGVTIKTPFDASSSFDIGDTVDDDEYTSTAIDADAVAGTYTALTITGQRYTERTTLQLLPNAGLTVGEADIVVLYVVHGVGDLVEG